MIKVLVVAGPTASGKSAFAIRLAKQFHGEIISGDSIQVYRSMDIGSGKIMPSEMAGIPHHLIDILDCGQTYSVADFQRMSREKISNCKGLPIIAGGTGLYLKACLYDYEFQEETTFSGMVEKELEQYDNETLFHMLQQRDSKQADKIHPHNRQRLLRSLTIIHRSGLTQSELIAKQEHKMIYDCFIVGCSRKREELYAGINLRVEQMVKQGLEKEVRTLLAKGVSFSDLCMRGIGYREWEPYINGEASLEDVVKEIQKHSRQYAKRQYTWFRNQMSVRWVDMSQSEDVEKVVKEIATWLEKN